MSNEKMVGFGPKQAWLAVRNGRPDTMIAALGLKDLGPVSWRDGVDLAYLTDDRVAVTPPLPGADDVSWALLTGRWLLIWASAVDIADLSRRLDTEVQAFSSYRVGEAHGWERAVNGTLVRSFAYIGQTGEVTRWHGEPDASELAVGLPPQMDMGTEVLIGEADVMRLAGLWSVNPTALDGQPASERLRAAAAGPPAWNE
jgi:hypothetical protein